MERGTIKWFDELKGYGFILSDIGAKEIFIHSSNIENLSKILEKGDRVEFEIEMGQNGPQAKRVRPIMEE